MYGFFILGKTNSRGLIRASLNDTTMELSFSCMIRKNSGLSFLHFVLRRVVRRVKYGMYRLKTLHIPRIDRNPVLFGGVPEFRDSVCSVLRNC